jgi:hypothetical protein
MREIRFNAWIPKIKCMVESVNVGCGMIGFASDDDNIIQCLKESGFDYDKTYDLPEWLYDTGEDWFTIHEESEFVLLQYTGLKDRNGIEIYEGDIVREDFRQDGSYCSTGVVEFYEGSFGSRNEHDCFRIPALFSGKAVEGMNLNYYEVVGNIYQNPELLTAVKA